MNEENEKPKFKGRDWKLEVRACSTRKLREDSTWSRLEPEQIEMLEEWLFEENPGYAKTVERVKKEFGIVTTVPSVARYYRRRVPERQAEQLVEAQITANGLNGLPVDANSLRTATLKLVGKAALSLAGETPKEIEQNPGRWNEQIFSVIITYYRLLSLKRGKIFLRRLNQKSRMHSALKQLPVRVIAFAKRNPKNSRPE